MSEKYCEVICIRMIPDAALSAVQRKLHPLNQVRREIVSSAGSWFEDASTTSFEDLSKTLRGIIGVYRKHHTIFSAMVQTAPNNPEVERLSRQLRDDLCQESRKAVRQLRQAGRANPGADDLTADLLTLAIDHCSTLHPEMLKGRKFDDLVKAWTHISWAALADTRAADLHA